MDGVVYTGIKQLVTLAPLVARGYPSRVTEADLGLVTDAWLHVAGGKVVASGSGKPPGSDRTVDLGGVYVMPGMVDAHTHPLFAGNRANEFAMRVNGATYQSIAAQGGGIQATVRATRAASDDDLIARAQANLAVFLSHGVTTVECKTGYGLSVAEELRHLRLLRRIKDASRQHLELTCLALHAWPLAGEDRAGFIDAMCAELLPRVAAEGLATAVDAFVESGYFTAADITPYIATAKALGLVIRLHVDEFTDVDGGRLAASHGALSADHCECTSPEGAAAMAAAGVTAVLLPGTSLYSKIPYAKAPVFRDAGTAMAIATDFNPGSCTFANLPMMASLAALYGGTTVAEGVAGVTYVPAFALRLGDKGHLGTGADADFCCYDSLGSIEEWLADFGKTRPREVRIAGEVAPLVG